MRIVCWGQNELPFEFLKLIQRRLLITNCFKKKGLSHDGENTYLAFGASLPQKICVALTFLALKPCLDLSGV